MQRKKVKVKSPVVGTAAAAKPGKLVTHSGYRATTTRPKPQPTYEMLRLGLESESRTIPGPNVLDGVPHFIIMRQMAAGRSVHLIDMDDPDDAADVAAYDLELSTAGHRSRWAK